MAANREIPKGRRWRFAVREEGVLVEIAMVKTGPHFVVGGRSA